MRRRDFLKNTAIAAPIMINGFPVTATPSTGNTFFDFLSENTYGCGRVLVIIQQNGGNDGLNTVIPLDKYSNLNNARNNIIIPEASVLPLNGNATTGLNPALAEIQNLYNNGKVCIVQAVSYPNPSFSHFRATDIWFSASNSNQDLDTGWLGRTLDTNYPDYPAVYPNTTMPDPLAIQIGATLPFSLQGPAVNMGYNVTNPTQLLNVINATTDPAPNNDYGRELTFLRQMKNQSNAYTARITGAYNAQVTKSTLYPASGNALADQLKIVARLIGGGLKTPVYIVNHPNTHDLHENQVVLGNTTTGTHANVLSILSKAINAFQDDIELMGKGHLVAGMTFSEFGRRIKSNASVGTDHGTSAPVMFFGAMLNGGMIGVSPNIPVNATVNDQVPMQHDFRQLYATVMQDWLCLTATQSDTVLGSNFTRLPVFNMVALPLDGVSLTGQYFNGESRLVCKAELNMRYDYFALEFSTNGISYTEVGRVVNQSLNEKENYSFLHQISSSKMYYRIASRDKQGKLDYSNVVLLRSADKKQLVRVYPNPIVNNRVNVQLFESTQSAVDITIYDLLGSKIYYNRFKASSNIISFYVPQSFSKDTHYILEVRYDETVTREQVIFK
ncbi:MAG: DUF1501 domain-containing protein [Gemmatimonadaceae bacterium]|nr:DUF1501 domain-containing protein [Chitinophagaceae bacterium]